MTCVTNIVSVIIINIAIINIINKSLVSFVWITLKINHICYEFVSICQQHFPYAISVAV